MEAKIPDAPPPIMAILGIVCVDLVVDDDEVVDRDWMERALPNRPNRTDRDMANRSVMAQTFEQQK